MSRHGERTSKPVACRPSEDYKLWLRFDDGLEGSVYLGNLLHFGAFRAWRDVQVFLAARVDADTGALVWAAGSVRLDGRALYRDLLASGAVRSVRPSMRADDLAFQRFMRAVLKAPRVRASKN